ncbi:Tfp pilus assembly protein FimT/FimU [Patescibacteria group bacterium]
MTAVRSRLQYGFTFIEILVAMGIMIMVFTLGVGSYREFARRQQINSASRDIKADLRHAQQEAIVGKKPNHIDCSNSDLIGYRVHYIDNTSYEIIADCVDGPVSVKTKQYSPDSDIEISPFPDFTFNALAKGVSSSQTIQITQVSVGVSRDIQIDQYGEIK